MKPKRFSQRIAQVMEKTGMSNDEMAIAMKIKPRMFSDYITGVFDESSGDSRRRKHLQKLDEIEIAYDAKMKRLSEMEPMQKGSINEILADQQRQIDELTGKLSRVMKHLGMN